MSNTEKTVPYNEANILLSEADLRMLLAEYSVTKPFKNIDTYRCAMVHKSYCTRKNENFFEGNVDCPANCIPLQEESNERLEFLGDSVLSIAIASYLFERYPDENEGFLTRLRTKIVNGKMLAKLSKLIGLEKYILISKQIEENDGRNISNILEDAFEAFLAAVYLDFDYETAKTFIISIVETHLDFSELIRTNTNYKDQILKHFQHTHGYTPKFYEVDVETDSNNHKCFKVCLKDKANNIISRGEGGSKKEAENAAAKKALERLCIEFRDITLH
jgi:ribonuclease-3